MQPSVGIRERISHVYPNLRPAERAVAAYVRGHINDAADLTIGQLAKMTQVSQPTVIRFARKLGFGGYRELRYALRNPGSEQSTTFDPLEGSDLNPWDSPDDVPSKAVANVHALIDEMRRALDITTFRKTCSMLAHADFIDVYGVENSLVPAMDLFTKLSYLGLPCRLNTDAYLQQIGGGHLPRGAVAIAFSHSGTSADTVKATRLAKTAGAKTIAVTNTVASPLAGLADVTMLTGTGEHTIHGNAIFSRAADVALVDMLYMGVLLSDYGRFSTALDESGRMIQDRAYRG